MKCYHGVIALLLLTAPAFAQDAEGPSPFIASEIGQLVMQNATLQWQISALRKHNAELEKQVADFKAKFEPKTKDEPAKD